MIKISRKVEYSLIVLQHLQQSEQGLYVTARTICDKYHTPFDTTSKVMQTMNNSDILASIQGTKGGYRLNKDLKSVSYLELVELIEGKKISNECSDIKCSLIDSCNITGPITKLNKHLVYYFQALSIKELLEDTPSPLSIIKESYA